jgi:hypothetical protein
MAAAYSDAGEHHGEFEMPWNDAIDLPFTIR